MTKPLVIGSKIVCPQCEVPQDVLAFVPLKKNEEYSLNQILKCKLCRHLFSPVVDPINIANGKQTL